MGLARWWVPLVILGPSLAWLALDRSVWPWDQAWFAAHTVELYETLRASPLAWPAALVRATPLKPPAVAWIGQFFVPLGLALRSVDAGLLLSVWTCHLAVLALILRVIWDLSGGRLPVAVAGTLVVGAAPLFIGLSTQYLGEASQALAVAWFVLIMTRAPRWSRPRLGAHLVAATCLAMLAKATSPIYCAAPGVVALLHLATARPRPSGPQPRNTGVWLRWLLALVLVLAGSAWYVRNLDSVVGHAKLAAFGSVAELYGRRETFLPALAFWSDATAGALFLRPVGWFVAVLLPLSAARRLRGRRCPRHLDVCAGAALFQLLVALSVHSISANRDPRYVAPLLPLAAVVVAWALAQGRSDWPANLAIGALGLQLISVQSQVFGLWRPRPPALQATVGLDPTLSVLETDAGPAAELTAIVQRTCGRGGFGGHNFVGVDLLRLNGHSLTYAAAKERLAGRAGECRYLSATWASPEFVMQMLQTAEYAYWVTVDTQVRPVPPEEEFLNRTAPVVFRRLRRRGILQPEPWNGPPGVLLFRFASH